MKNILSSLIFFVLFTTCISPTKSRIDILTLSSKVFGNERKLRVYLPEGYDGSKKFKVLYLNDGQNVFKNQELERKDNWRVDEIADSLIRLKQIEPIIIIAIDNIGMSKRGNEYLPWEDIYLSPPIPNPQGKKYPDFLIHEVMPLIESVYKVKTGRENTGVGGFSYGGLSAAFTVLVRSSNIGLLLAETPSLYVNNKKIFSEFLDSKKQFPLKVYLGVGTNELALSNCNEENEDNKMAVDDLKELGSIIQRKSTTTQVRINIAKCATHSFEEASKRLPVALKFLFPNADNQAH